MKKGILLAIGAYGLWGLFPIYWRQLEGVPATEIIAHRVVWSLVFVLGVIIFTRHFKKMIHAFHSFRVLLVYALAAALLAVNWTTYVWGINTGHIVEASLGYFINPLVSVLLGVVFFRERLRPWQWVAIGLATTGVVYLTVRYGSLPWIGLVLAFTFGTYGLIKKGASLEALEGLGMEMAFLTVPALLLLIHLQLNGTGAFGSAPLPTFLLIMAGVVTAIPLLMFASAARRIPLSMIGILQYIAPTLQFSIGVWIYGENFSTVRLTGFCFIWAALLVYTLEGLYARRIDHLDHLARAKP